MDNQSAVLKLSALAHDTRLAIFRLLVATGDTGLPVGHIGEQLGVAPATLSFHLKELSRAGLITARQERRFIFYTANYSGMRQLLDFLTDDCCGGLPCAVTTQDNCCVDLA